MITRIVPRPVAGITIELVQIEGTAIMPAEHTLYNPKWQ
jgi:hypothetical protein